MKTPGTSAARPFRARSLSPLLLALLPLLSGCAGHEASDRAPIEGAGFVARVLGPDPWDVGSGDAFGGTGRLPTPLALGDHWAYVTRSRTVLVTDQGPQPPTVVDDSVTTDITRNVRSGGRDYLLREDAVRGPDGPVVAQALMRQDRSGLFFLQHFEGTAASAPALGAAVPSAIARAIRASVEHALARSPRRAVFQHAVRTLAGRLEGLERSAPAATSGVPGGPAPGEASVLRYPLRLGARWDVGTTPPLTRSVAAREHVNVPAGEFIAWRVHSDAVQFGPEDRLDFWYADAGLVKISFHVEFEARDGLGNPIGTIISDTDQELTALRLVDRAGPRAYATATSGPAPER